MAVVALWSAKVLGPVRSGNARRSTIRTDSIRAGRPATRRRSRRSCRSELRSRPRRSAGARSDRLPGALRRSFLAQGDRFHVRPSVGQEGVAVVSVRCCQLLAGRPRGTPGEPRRTPRRDPPRAVVGHLRSARPVYRGGCARPWRGGANGRVSVGIHRNDGPPAWPPPLDPPSVTPPDADADVAVVDAGQPATTTPTTGPATTPTTAAAPPNEEGFVIEDDPANPRRALVKWGG